MKLLIETERCLRTEQKSKTVLLILSSFMTLRKLLSLSNSLICEKELIISSSQGNFDEQVLIRTPGTSLGTQWLKNPPANAGDTGSIPCPGRSHVPVCRNY